jgi:hypothetical protein
LGFTFLGAFSGVISSFRNIFFRVSRHEFSGFPEPLE